MKGTVYFIPHPSSLNLMNCSSRLKPVVSALAASAILLTAVLSSARPAAAQGFNANYLPFDASRLRRFPLKRVELPDDLRSGRPASVSGVRLQEEMRATDDAESASRLVFSGRDGDGRPWRFETDPHPYYDAVYEGDLDRNGVRDLVLSIGTGANGLGPPTHLIFLTFDARGRPTTFEATGYFDPQPQGIYDVTDLDGDGRAELLFMVFDDGYWVTNLYRVRDARWSRVSGRFAGLNFPAYTRFTRRPNHRPVRPARGRNPVAPDLLKENRIEG
jgi:hypothetical protein